MHLYCENIVVQTKHLSSFSAFEQEVHLLTQVFTTNLCQYTVQGSETVE